MMRRSIATVCLSGTLDEKLAAAANAGFDGMEIERYTLATGKTAIGSFQRLWRPWGAIIAAAAVLATMWPGWATAAATVLTFAVGGGDPNRSRSSSKRRPAPPGRGSAGPGGARADAGSGRTRGRPPRP